MSTKTSLRNVFMAGGTSFLNRECRHRVFEQEQWSDFLLLSHVENLFHILTLMELNRSANQDWYVTKGYSIPCQSALYYI